VLKKEFGAESDLVESRGGVFEVELDGKLIFSKKKLERFPFEGEIEAIVRKSV
jgi:selT/selW/selH-like putative selenoprotein